MPHTLDTLPLSNSFAQLDPKSYARLVPTPFDEHPGREAYADHPPAWAEQLSVSCSS